MNLLRLKDVCELIKTSRSNVYKMIESDPSFPKKIKFSNSKQAAVYFEKEEIESWVKSKKVNGDM